VRACRRAVKTSLRNRWAAWVRGRTNQFEFEARESIQQRPQLDGGLAGLEPRHCALPQVDLFAQTAWVRPACLRAPRRIAPSCFAFRRSARS